ncbi:DUF421 domain-containing protein [Micromonospora sp. WMMD1274]|uniref:DUF421 domain-containing protein n=1 Tax=Micromonospora sp. WMMD1274 TaxID=3404116 RepID=UPI003B95D41B
MGDWRQLLIPDTPLWEIALRGSVVYLTIFVLLRVLLKRESGSTGVTDLLVIVLIADAAQDAMADDYRSITDGVLLVTVIIGWAYLLDVLSYRWPVVARLVNPGPLLLVRDGRILHRNMRRELITEDELFSQLRQHGVERLDQVKEVRMESQGQFSVITRGNRERRG